MKETKETNYYVHSNPMLKFQLARINFHYSAEVQWQKWNIDLLRILIRLSLLWYAMYSCSYFNSA